MSDYRCPQPSPASSEIPTSSPRSERAQASVEFLGSLPVLALGALVCVQGFLVALSMIFMQVSADRWSQGASASVATQAVPSPWRQRTTVNVQSAHKAKIKIVVPILFPAKSKQLRLSTIARRV